MCGNAASFQPFRLSWVEPEAVKREPAEKTVWTASELAVSAAVMPPRGVVSRCKCAELCKSISPGP